MLYSLNLYSRCTICSITVTVGVVRSVVDHFPGITLLYNGLFYHFVNKDFNQ